MFGTVLALNIKELQIFSTVPYTSNKCTYQTEQISRESPISSKNKILAAPQHNKSCAERPVTGSEGEANLLGSKRSVWSKPPEMEDSTVADKLPIRVCVAGASDCHVALCKQWLEVVVHIHRRQVQLLRKLPTQDASFTPVAYFLQCSLQHAAQFVEIDTDWTSRNTVSPSTVPS